MAALGEALQPQSRSGLTLFLRRGMSAWARALTDESLVQRPSHRPSFARAECFEPQSIIHILAAMAINVKNRRIS